MPDRISTDRRSAIMRSIRQKHTAPEMVVRGIVHAIGAHYRLYRKDLPGRPDLVFPRRRLCIFVHGCFWHRHRAAAWPAPLDPMSSSGGRSLPATLNVMPARRTNSKPRDGV